MPREVPSGDLLFAGAHVATGSRTPRRIFVLGDILQTRALAALAGHGRRRDIVTELDLRIANDFQIRFPEQNAVSVRSEPIRRKQRDLNA